MYRPRDDHTKWSQRKANIISFGIWASLVAQMVKRLPTMRKIQVQSLGWEDLLEKEMATHSSILAWRIPRMEEHGRLQSMGSQRVGHDWSDLAAAWTVTLKKIWKNGIETCIISCMKRVTSPGSMQDTGCLGLVHWDDPEGWYGEEVGGGFRMGNTCTPVADSCWCMAKPIQYCKVISLQLK